jgi:hypothetical protein
VQIGQMSSFFRVFLSTRSSVSRKEGGRPPRVFDSEGSLIQSVGSTGWKFKAESGICVGIGNPVGGDGLGLHVSLRLRRMFTRHGIQGRIECEMLVLTTILVLLRAVEWTVLHDGRLFTYISVYPDIE